MSMRAGLNRFYKIQEFAELAGVTVKALHHYDRLGLLKTGRSGAGYRLYSDRDLERLEQIVALKFLGLPLKQIRIVLDRAALELPDALRLQRRALQEKRALLDRAIRAIQAAEETLEPGRPADPAILKKLIEVIDMQDSIEVMKKYYGTEESWERHKRYYEEGPSQEWRDLYRDVAALLDKDPGCEEAQALLERYFELGKRAYAGDPDVQIDSPTAWMDRANWPAAMKQRIAEFKLEEVTEFLKQAALATRKKYFSAEAWAKVEELRKAERGDASRRWQARVDLFRDIEAALAEDPASEKAQALAARWMSQLDQTTGGNAEIKAGMLRGWALRRGWPESHRHQVEALHGMSWDRFLKCADLIEQALAARPDQKTVVFTDANFDAEVLRSDVPVLVSFSAPWCGGCRAMAPAIDAIATEYAGRVKVGKLDADSNNATPQRYEIRSLPTLLVFKSGNVVEQRVGAMDKAELQKILDPHL
jgi:thioredoxin